MIGSADERRRREAAEWVARRRGDWTPTLQQQLDKWCADDPENRAAFERIQRTYDQAGLLRHSQMAASRSLPDERRSGPRYALAAGLAVVLVAGSIVMFSLHSSAPVQASLIATAAGQTKRLQLADGSAVVLDPASQLRVELTRDHRLARLEKGRVQLTVAKDPRPFELVAGSSRTEVTEGRIEATMSAGGKIMRLEMAGEKVPPIAQGTLSWISAEPTKAVGKPAQPRVEFDAVTLAGLVEQANRSAGSKPILVSPAAASLRVTGVFQLGDNVALAESLAAALGLALVVQPDGALLLTTAKINGG